MEVLPGLVTRLLLPALPAAAPSHGEGVPAAPGAVPHTEAGRTRVPHHARADPPRPVKPAAGGWRGEEGRAGRAPREPADPAPPRLAPAGRRGTASRRPASSQNGGGSSENMAAAGPSATGRLRGGGALRGGSGLGRSLRPGRSRPPRPASLWGWDVTGASSAERGEQPGRAPGKLLSVKMGEVGRDTSAGCAGSVVAVWAKAVAGAELLLSRSSPRGEEARRGRGLGQRWSFPGGLCEAGWVIELTWNDLGSEESVLEGCLKGAIRGWDTEGAVKLCSMSGSC